MQQQPRLLAGRYELIAPIGRGTMGTVWRAHDRTLGREVAIKEIRQDPGLSPEQRAELRARMLREGRTAARINHPSVATVYDAIEDGGSPWIIMELIEGRSLEQVIDEEGPLPPRLVAEIGVDLLGALRAAHAQGILHRDVKPGNVLLTEMGRVVLTDFGIAKAAGDSKLTRTGMVIGSPGYTAPERARGDYTGPESDLWSLGATLYFAVEGRPAYERKTVAETLAALMTEDADPPTQAGPLRPLLMAMLEKDHRARLPAAKAAAMLRAIADTPSTEPVREFDPGDFEANDRGAWTADAPASPPARSDRPAPPAKGETPASAPADGPDDPPAEIDPNQTVTIARPRSGPSLPAAAPASPSPAASAPPESPAAPVFPPPRTPAAPVFPPPEGRTAPPSAFPPPERPSASAFPPPEEPAAPPAAAGPAPASLFDPAPAAPSHPAWRPSAPGPEPSPPPAAPPAGQMPFPGTGGGEGGRPTVPRRPPAGQPLPPWPPPPTPHPAFPPPSGPPHPETAPSASAEPHPGGSGIPFPPPRQDQGTSYPGIPVAGTPGQSGPPSQLVPDSLQPEPPGLSTDLFSITGPIPPKAQQPAERRNTRMLFFLVCGGVLLLAVLVILLVAVIT